MVTSNTQHHFFIEDVIIKMKLSLPQQMCAHTWFFGSSLVVAKFLG
jgi:hypothetical protein